MAEGVACSEMSTYFIYVMHNRCTDVKFWVRWHLPLFISAALTIYLFSILISWSSRVGRKANLSRYVWLCRLLLVEWLLYHQNAIPSRCGRLMLRTWIKTVIIWSQMIESHSNDCSIAGIGVESFVYEHLYIAMYKSNFCVWCEIHLGWWEEQRCHRKFPEIFRPVPWSAHSTAWPLDRLTECVIVWIHLNGPRRRRFDVSAYGWFIQFNIFPRYSRSFVSVIGDFDGNSIEYSCSTQYP